MGQRPSCTMNGHRPHGHGARVVAVVLGAFFLCGCGPGGAGEGPGHRVQHLGLTAEQELQLGEKAYQEVLSKAEVEPEDSAETRRVRGVGERIAKTTEIQPLVHEINLHLAGYRFDWEFRVLRDRRVNAFCLPGGKVAVFTGLLPIADTDDFLATVLSHEIAHALAHHASERVARVQKEQRFLDLAGVFTSGFDPQTRKELIGILAAGAQFGSLPYDRKQESEADHIGIFLMTFAGYDPRQAIVFWERMQRASRGGHVPKLLSDHPSDAERIAQLRKWAPQALAGKEAYDHGRIAR